MPGSRQELLPGHIRGVIRTDESASLDRLRHLVHVVGAVEVGYLRSLDDGGHRMLTEWTKSCSLVRGLEKTGLRITKLLAWHRAS
jgi:hypothetical protein